jgi:uncharacterized membrane protein
VTATGPQHPEVRAYLERLDRAAAHLPAGRRGELGDEIAGHLAQALPDGPTAADVAQALDRLGPPEEIVAAEEAGQPPAGAVSSPAVPAGRPARGTGHEAVAVGMLTVGAVVLPVVGWLVGVLLLWTSRLWTTREKVLGTVLVPGGPATALLTMGAFAVVTAESCTTVRVGDAVEPATTCTGGVGVPGWLLLLGLLLAAAAPVAVGVVLYRRARERVSGTATAA